MLYKNIKTGVTIDVTSVISGGDWVPLEKIDNEKEEIAEEIEAEETTEEEFVEEEVDLKELTNKQLEDLAEEQGIELTTKDKKDKDARIAAIVAGLE